jgi:quercetin dioxygenase-like cupin family protein
MNKENAENPKKLLINRKGLKVVRLTLAAGGSIPEHSTNADLVVVTVKGEGIFYINKKPTPIKQGEVIELAPNILHAIDAKSDLELIVTHMHLASETAEVMCGDKS